MSAAAPPQAVPALALRDLRVEYRVRGVWKEVLRGVTFSIAEGESYGLVGESGCGKSTAAYAVVHYLPRNGRISGGSIAVAGADLADMSGRDVRRMRAERVGMVYQNPGAALNPTIRVGDQVAEVYQLAGTEEKLAHERSEAMLAKVQIADPGSVMRRYPHQLSGGMQQRVVIAMALAKDPTLLVLDEPTTGLDATVEAEVLDLVAALRAEFGTSVLFISHNLDVIARMCDRVGVLYAGRLVEEGPVDAVFNDPRHPYAVGLLRCIPRGGVRKDRERLDTIPGFPPTLGAELPACVYVDRCGLAQDICGKEEPAFHDLGSGRQSRCHFWEQAHELPRAEPPTPIPSSVDQDAAARGAGGAPVQDVQAGRAGDPCRGGSRARAAPRGDARPRGGVGQRQDDAGAAAPRPDRARRGLHRRAGRQARSRARSATATASRSARCRSCSRIPTRRSTAASRSTASSLAPSPSCWERPGASARSA